MRTETRTYTLSRITELSEKAKEKAYNQWLCNGYFYGWTHENRQTLDAFCERFGIVSVDVPVPFSRLLPVFFFIYRHRWHSVHEIHG